MSLAIGWDTPEGVPTTPSLIVLGAVLTMLTIGVMLIVRRHDRQKLLQERLPYSKLVMQNREMAEDVKHLAERHEVIIRQRGQWLADQVSDHGEQLEELSRVVCEIRSHLLDDAGPAQPRLTVIKGR